MKYLLILLTLVISPFTAAKEYSLPGLTVSPLYYWIESEIEAPSPDYVLENARWIEVEGELNLGYSQQTVWFTQILHGYQPGDWIFQVSYPLLDYLDLYLYEGDKLVQTIHTGDAVPFSQKGFRVNDFIMSISTHDNAHYRLLGRINTQGTMMLPIKWYAEKEYAENLILNQIIFGVYYGMLLIMAIYHMFVYVVIRERGFLLYVLSVSSFILLQLTFDGRGFAFFWPESPGFNQYSFPLAYLLYLLAIFSLISEFLKLKQNHQHLYRYFYVLRVLVVVLIPLIFIFSYNAILPIVIALAITGLVSALVVSAYLWSKGFVAARFFTCAWAVFLIGIIALNLRGVGVGTTTLFSQYGYIVGSMLEVLFLAFSLADRINTVNKEKRKTEKELLNTQSRHVKVLEQYQNLYEYSPVGNFLADNNYQFISMNVACAQLFGFEKPEEMMAEVKDIRQYLESDIEDFKNFIKLSRRSRAVFNREVHIKDKNDKDRWLSVSIRFNQDEGVGNYEGSLQDISERKTAEKLKVELDRERLHIMEQFSIGIAKEINTPLGSNVATTSYLQDRLNEIYLQQSEGNVTLDKYQSFIKLAYQSLGLLENNQKRITRVVKRFKEVSIYNLGLKEHHFILVDVINEAIESQRWKMAGWRVNLLCANDIRMHSYPKAIGLIISQLIDNALTHSMADHNQDPKIWIRVERDESGNLMLIFSDNGKGIKKEMAKNLCQPFFTTRRGPEGHVGLGLYMVYNLVTRSLNGRIFFPVMGSGFSVQIKIPTDITDSFLSN